VTTDFDKAQWQAEQEERDRISAREQEKFEKARARSARNAKRKIARLRAKLEASGELTDWEDEFSESVGERLETFGSAFQDRTKGRPGDALSFAQKRVVAALNKKAKGNNLDKASSKPKRGFKSRNGFTPRVRNIEDDMVPEETEDDQVFIPSYTPENGRAKRPFLKIVK